MRLVISLALACTHAFVTTPSPRPLTRLRAAPAQDTVRLQKKISAFEAEVKLMKERYVALAAWLVHLLKEKRGVAAPAAAPAAARGSTSRLDRARRSAEPEKGIKKGKGKAKAGPSRSW